MKGMHKRFKMDTTLTLKPAEFKTHFGSDKFIFVGSSTDIFAKDVPHQWWERVITFCKNKPKNKYLFQTKNPESLYHFINVEYESIIDFFRKNIICITIESSHNFRPEYGNSPEIIDRFIFAQKLKELGCQIMITIEPIMDFELEFFVSYMKEVTPIQINIGADSGNNNLPEPSKEKVLALISELEKFTKVVQKPNLKRLIIEEI
jgi:DNA repair photolyase